MAFFRNRNIVWRHVNFALNCHHFVKSIDYDKSNKYFLKTAVLMCLNLEIGMCAFIFVSHPELQNWHQCQNRTACCVCQAGKQRLVHAILGTSNIDKWKLYSSWFAPNHRIFSTEARDCDKSNQFDIVIASGHCTYVSVLACSKQHVSRFNNTLLSLARFYMLITSCINRISLSDFYLRVCT